MPSPITVTADLSLGHLTAPVLTASSPPAPFIVKNEYPSSGLPDLLSLELYHKALEGERQKIEAFKRELPFCMRLLDNAIEASKEQLADRLPDKGSIPPQLRYKPYIDPLLRGSQPGLGELMNFKRKWTRPDCPRNQENEQPAKRSANGASDAEAPTKTGLEPHWNLAVAHRKLENDGFPKECCRLEEVARQEKLDAENCGSICQRLATLNENNGTLGPNGNIDHRRSKHRQNEMGEVLHLSRSSLELHGAEQRNAAIDSCNKDWNPLHGAIVERKSNSGQPQRKPRRCWSPALHQRFLSALKQLGGSQAATPKQIRELMNVEGLTNDEVKSHLQKFRLHLRRPNSASHLERQQRSGHLVVFGGIWVPPVDGKYCNGAAVAPHQRSELHDVSTGLVEETFPAHDLSSNRNANAVIDNSSCRENRSEQLVCRNFMEEPAGCRELDAPLDDPGDEEARSESASLNEEEDEKTENHLERFGGFSCLIPTNEGVKTEIDVKGIKDEARGCDSQSLSEEGSFQRKSAPSPVQTTLALKSFLTDLMHLSCDVDMGQKAGRKEVLCDETSSDVNSSTVLKGSDPLQRTANGVLTKQNHESPKLEEVEMKSNGETDLSIGCLTLPRSSNDGDDNATCP